MPYIARTEELPTLACTGGIIDPRADHQPSFSKRMSCRDVADFISNTAKPSPLVSQSQKVKQRGTYLDKLDKILSRSGEIKGSRQPVKNGLNGHGLNGHGLNGHGLNGHGLNGHGLNGHGLNGHGSSSEPLSDLIPSLVISGGRSRSPAFDSLPTVSHWADRTSESSETDPAASIRLTSTWGTTHVVGEGSTMASPLGAPCWSLKSHGIAQADVGSPKFSQHYVEQTDTLTTTMALPRREDTAKTGGVLSAVASISWMRNARVADAADCATGLLANAVALLEARDKMLASGQTERLPFAEVRPVTMPSWCTARKPLPPKLSGVALSPDQFTVDLLEKEECEGPLVNTSIFSMAVGYNRGVYGGSISGLWALMDSAFVFDYTVGVKSAELADSLSTAFADVASIAETASSSGPHITDISIVKGCNYGCLRQKTITEDGHTNDSSPCVVVWNDLARLARYKLADAVFCHVYYDSGGGEQMAAIAGLGCVAHDWIDLGADVACGEISNIVPSLTNGSLEEEPLAEVYARLTGVMIWYRDNDPYNPAALCLLFTHWWQLANCRHRPIALLGRMDLDINAAITAIVPESRPCFEDFRACGAKVERGEVSMAKAEARLQALLSSNPLPETRAVIDLLVNPVLAYMRGGDGLPAESEYVGAVLAAELAYPHGQKILELWDLAIVMWECGALWGAGMAGLCYTHTGKTNCDRARGDYSDTTWT